MEFAQLKASHQWVLRQTENRFRLEGEHPPYVLAFFANGKHKEVDVTRFMQPGLKFMVEKMMILAVKCGAECVALVSEGYAAEATDENHDELLETAREGEIHRLPTRKEVLMVLIDDPQWMYCCTLSIDQKKVVGQWQIRHMAVAETADKDLGRFQDSYRKAARINQPLGEWLAG